MNEASRAAVVDIVAQQNAELAIADSHGHIAIAHLLEVKVPVEAILGTLSMTLRDITSLRAGSILRTDKAASEPLDLRVNSVRLASAEVSPRGDKLGLRLLELHLQD